MNDIKSVNGEKIKERDKVKLKKEDTTYKGIVMPSSDNENIVIKLKSGYNVGIKVKDAKVELIDRKKPKKEEKEKKEQDVQKREEKPTLSILTTGGTIASSVDYRTGAVTSQFNAKDILENIPELKEIANYRSKVVFNTLSENMEPNYWIKLSKAIKEEIKEGVDGIIVAHGTDTMTYTASAISFMINSPIPIVFVGSQRSADRPSSDNVLNAISAAKVAKSDIAETMIVMHGETSDSFCYALRANKARKMHTSRRDAFRPINDEPIAKIGDEVIKQTNNYQKRGGEPEIKNNLNEDVSLIKYAPGMDVSLLEKSAKENDGLVIEGTGLGHVSKRWIPKIEEIIEEGTPIVMASQCLYGRVSDRVYDTGRDLIKAGVIQADDMLPEVAYVKLMWALERTDNQQDLKKLMKKNISGEITERTKKDTYLI